MTPFAQATPSQIAAHQAHQARLKRLWVPEKQAPVEYAPIHPLTFVNLIRPPCGQVIIDLVAAKYGFKPRELIGEGKSADLSHARREAIHLARTHTRQSLPQLGRLFNRDHTSILNSLRIYETGKGRKHSPGKLHLHRWTRREIDALKEMWARGYSMSAISARLGPGISKASVKGQIVYHNLARKRKVNWPAQDKAQLLSLWNAGLTATKIGEVMGKTKGSIVGQARRMNLDRRAPPNLKRAA